ncbi:MAG: hypothetical protein HYS05_05010 [Acidobacteria bacterium]|nr:hypothetical protein [Acidobacteriota bacterium]
MIQRLLGLPIVASEHGPQLDFYTALVHLLMLALFLGWGAYFVFALHRFSAKRHPRADYYGTKSKFGKQSEIVVGIIEVLFLVGFAFPAWAIRVNAFPPESEATVVRVIGEQFAWNVHYPGADGKFGRTDIKLVDANNPLGLDRRDPDAKDDITTINQLSLPIDKPVIVHLSSKDVIHSFGLPYFRVKQDAIPGMTIPVWFKPTMLTPEGESWEIACSQLCGLGHYRMRGFITIMTPDKFAGWLKEQAAAQ